MSAALLPRSSWTSVPRPVGRLTALDPAEVRGLAVHWPGSTGTWGPSPTLAQSASRLEAERQQHTSQSSSDPTKPWTDIAYNLACDLAGRLFDARGLEWRSAANGDVTVNRQWVAVTVLMGSGDTVTPAAVDAVRTAHALVLARYPHATAVVGHRDLHSTDCPGPQLYADVRSGAFTTPAQEDDLPTADELIDRLAARAQAGDPAVRAIIDAFGSRLWAWPFPAGTTQDPKRVETSGERLVWASRQSALAPSIDTIVGALRAGVPVQIDYGQLADAIVQRLPAGQQVDVRALASALADDLGARLRS